MKTFLLLLVASSCSLVNANGFFETLMSPFVFETVRKPLSEPLSALTGSTIATSIDSKATTAGTFKRGDNKIYPYSIAPGRYQLYNYDTEKYLGTESTTSGDDGGQKLQLSKEEFTWTIVPTTGGTKDQRAFFLKTTTPNKLYLGVQLRYRRHVQSKKKFFYRLRPWAYRDINYAQPLMAFCKPKLFPSQVQRVYISALNVRTWIEDKADFSNKVRLHQSEYPKFEFALHPASAASLT